MKKIDVDTENGTENGTNNGYECLTQTYLSDTLRYIGTVSYTHLRAPRD